MRDLRDLQIRRLDCAVDESKAIESRLESMSGTIDSILGDLDDLHRSLRSIRLGLFREDASVLALAEITVLKRMLDNLPEGSVIDRASLEARLAKVLEPQEDPSNG